MACATPDLFAQQPDHAGFHVQQWRIKDGLPQATVTDLAISSDGFLYVGTRGGLCRFDGQRIRVYDTVSAPGLPSNRIVAVHEANDGTLWIGTQDHGITRLADDHLHPLDDIDYGGIFEIGADGEGHALVSCSRGLFREVDGKLRLVTEEAPPFLDFETASDGTVYGASRAGLFRIGTDKVEQVRKARASALTRRNDRLFVLGWRGIAVLENGRLKRLEVGLQPSTQRDLLCAPNGDLWIAGEHGVAYLTSDAVDRALAGERVDCHTDFDLPANRAISLCQDTEGGIWAGFERFGLARLRPAMIRIHGGDEGLPPERLTTVLADEQGTLLATSRSGLIRRVDDRFERVGTANKLRLLLRDSKGRIWASHDEVLCRIEGDKPVPFPLVNAPDQKRKLPEFGQLRTMVELADGRLWVLGQYAIVEIEDGLARMVRAFNKLRTGAMTVTTAAPDGAIWIGGPNMILRIDPADGTHHIWRSGEELPVGGTRAILPEAGLNAWAASYGGGIVRIDAGNASAIAKRHGLIDQSLCGIATFGDSLFVTANRGCFLVERSAALAVARGQLEALACRMLVAEGSLVAECNGGSQRNLVVDERGHYWVCGVHGMYEFVPQWLKPRPRVLTPYVQQLVIGETEYPDPATAKPDPTARTVAVRLGVNAFDDHDRVRFRWRAPGIRPEWTPATYEREIRIDGLPAGELSIEVEAIDVDDAHSPTPMRVSVVLPARIWETTPFWITIGLSLVALVWLLVRAFSAQERRRARRLQELVEGRTRELTEARDRLEDHVAARTRELRDALELTELESERRQKLEKELNDLRLSEAIGKLAGGVAHDFNNLLTVTLSSGQLLEYELESESALELARNIVAASARGRSLTQHLLAVASRQVVSPEPMALQDVMQELQEVLRPLLGEDIDLRIEAPEQPAIVRGARTQIEQILINLTANARDAIEGAGAVTIAIEGHNGHITLSVTDDGCGMSDEVRAKAFEPFYSTKDQEGIGRGLGLATVFGITKQLGGEVEIESEVGKGTTVRVVLPRDQAKAEPGAIASEPPSRFEGRVLLIEDQLYVRNVLQRQLERLGCEVTTAGDGDAAIAMLADDPKIDLVVSDVVMPGLQGAALVEALRAQVPDLQVVFMSGYMDGRRAHTDISDLGFDVLAKPVDEAELARALARHLKSPTSRG